VQRVLPDGCADIIVGEDGAALIAGPAHHVSLPELSPGMLRGLRLRTEAIGPLFGLHASVLADATVALDAVLSGPRARTISETVAGQAAPDDAPRWWSDVVVDRRVRAACVALGDAGATVDRVAHEVGLSGRQLRRLLLQATGQGPKMLQRVGRLHRFLDLAERGPDIKALAELAAASGYADQAHLSREVKDLSGTTPVALLRERRPRGAEP
jgi:AraC-like DNA-binding protein